MEVKVFRRLPIMIKKNFTPFFSVFILLAFFSGLSWGASQTSVSPAISKSPVVRSDVIRTGDTLVIRLSGVPEGEGGIYENPVTDDGMISMPLVGSFKASGKSVGELKGEIEAAYRDGKIYANPNITIVQQARFINVIGEVRNPQRVAYTSDLSVLKAISACGGFTDYANRRSVKVLRGSQVIRFNANVAIENPSKDLPLEAGDQLQVPRTIF